MAWLTSETHTPPHMCYHANFGRSVLKDIGMGGVAYPKIHAPPHTCYHFKFGSSAMRQRVCE